MIIDLNMPNMDGIGVIKEVRKMDTYKAVPILMLTTESQTVKREEAREAGATGWVIKPFVADRLLAVVKKLIR
jgi:two-component system chemotaxis response regulator CheY